MPGELNGPLLYRRYIASWVMMDYLVHTRLRHSIPRYGSAPGLDFPAVWERRFTDLALQGAGTVESMESDFIGHICPFLREGVLTCPFQLTLT